MNACVCTACIVNVLSSAAWRGRCRRRRAGAAGASPAEHLAAQLQDRMTRPARGAIPAARHWRVVDHSRRVMNPAFRRLRIGVRAGHCSNPSRTLSLPIVLGVRHGSTGGVSRVASIGLNIFFWNAMTSRLPPPNSALFFAGGRRGRAAGADGPGAAEGADPPRAPHRCAPCPGRRIRRRFQPVTVVCLARVRVSSPPGHSVTVDPAPSSPRRRAHPDARQANHGDGLETAGEILRPGKAAAIDAALAAGSAPSAAPDIGAGASARPPAKNSGCSAAASATSLHFQKNILSL